MSLPPYAHLLGVTVEPGDEAPTLVMPFADDVLGRPGFLHGGAIAGLLVARFGVVAVRLIASTARSRPSVAPPVKVNGPTTRTMTARYSGSCVDCRTIIRPGDEIQHLGPRQTRCAQCVTAP